MHPLRILMVSACVAPLLGGPASAQVEMYPGQDVSVNPAGVRGGQVLLYPGGTMARVVPPLREPGTKGGVIHLHMPVKHRAVRHLAAAPAPPAESETATSQEEAPAPIPPTKKRRVAMTPPPEPAASAPAPEATAPQSESQSSGATIPFSFDSSSSSPVPSSPAPAAPKQAPQKPATKLATVTPPPATTARQEPSASGGNLVRRGRILFPKDATEPVAAASNGIRMLAGDLNDSLLKGAERIELLAYGGQRNDKGSDARRLSLKRALAVRQLLIDRGVPSDRIDVRAMGGAGDGDLDRVDVFIKQG